MSIELVQGDLLEQTDCEVIVNAWNCNFPWWFLLVQHGVAGAIRKRAGWRVLHEIGYTLMPAGAARITSAGRLPFKGIIHVAGIDWHRCATTHSVRQSAANAIHCARHHHFTSIAMPIIGSGVGGMKPERALDLMQEGIRRADPFDTMRVKIVQYAPPGTLSRNTALRLSYTSSHSSLLFSDINEGLHLDDPNDDGSINLMDMRSDGSIVLTDS